MSGQFGGAASLGSSSDQLQALEKEIDSLKAELQVCQCPMSFLFLLQSCFLSSSDGRGKLYSKKRH